VSEREVEMELRPISQRRAVLAATVAASSGAMAREGLPLGILKLERGGRRANESGMERMALGQGVLKTVQGRSEQRVCHRPLPPVAGGHAANVD
jgi:hypothetical protein